MKEHISKVPLDKAFRLLNHGPTVLVSAQAEETVNVMAASWCCALDFSPPKLTVVIDKGASSRKLIEDSGRFTIQIPTVAQVEMVYKVGHSSLADDPNKLANSGVELFQLNDSLKTLVAGCSAWLDCKVVPEAHNQNTYDLFIGEVTAAWADSRVFSDGHWHYETSDPDLRSLHYISGGHFYAIGEAIDAKSHSS